MTPVCRCPVHGEAERTWRTARVLPPVERGSSPPVPRADDALRVGERPRAAEVTAALVAPAPRRARCLCRSASNRRSSARPARTWGLRSRDKRTSARRRSAKAAPPPAHGREAAIRRDRVRARRRAGVDLARSSRTRGRGASRSRERRRPRTETDPSPGVCVAYLASLYQAFAPGWPLAVHPMPIRLLSSSLGEDWPKCKFTHGHSPGNGACPQVTCAGSLRGHGQTALESTVQSLP